MCTYLINKNDEFHTYETEVMQKELNLIIPSYLSLKYHVILFMNDDLCS